MNYRLTLLFVTQLTRLIGLVSLDGAHTSECSYVIVGFRACLSLDLCHVLNSCVVASASFTIITALTPSYFISQTSCRGNTHRHGNRRLNAAPKSQRHTASISLRHEYVAV